MIIRDVTFENRAWLSAMCQYSSVDGLPNDWHLVHLGARAAGGFGLVMTEAAAVLPAGRISPEDAGLWNEEQQNAWARIVDFGHQQGARMGVQLAHAGRKASVFRPWSRARGSVPAQDGGWPTVSASAQAFPGYDEPESLTSQQISTVVQAFAEAAVRADLAGFDVVEVHAAHGYLLHQFLSPRSNLRTDEYGGDLDGRAKLLIEVVDAIRANWPTGKPVFVRLSGTDWIEDGWDIEQTWQVSALLAEHGVDLVDVSSGGNEAKAPIPVGPGYQVPLAHQVREHAKVRTAAVGLITDPIQAEQILVDGSADAVFLARAGLREPAWPQRAAHELGVPAGEINYRPQYERGAWR